MTTAAKRINVLVYSGNGSTVESVRHCLYTLRRLLSPNYAIIPVTGDTILSEPWTASCALLVFPGGADLGYCRTLNGEGNRRIIQYVNQGGNYLGFCAGGYYGSGRCEFEVGDPKMGVVGDRELSFFPGICRGLAFPGFVYHSEAGTRAVELEINEKAFPVDTIKTSKRFRCYYNGGGLFVDTTKLSQRGVEVLATYTEKVSVDSGEGPAAAVVYRKVGEGGVILTGPHPEFDPININKSADGPGYSEIVDILLEHSHARAEFLKACLLKFGLKVNPEDQMVPSLSRLHLSAHQASDVSELLSSWQKIITVIDNDEYIKGENDTFKIEKPSTWSMDSLNQSLPTSLSHTSIKNLNARETDEQNTSADLAMDYNKIIKKVVAHETALPLNKETPHFNHHAFFANLHQYNSTSPESEGAFGKYILYGEVVTSTNTLLEKNITLLNCLPPGFTATATTQIAARGRGTNVWVAPPGQLMFSTVLRHPIALNPHAPIIFIQYIAALATVAGIQTYARGYADLPVKLKWPNDIYALEPNNHTPENSSKSRYVKIGGVLVNSSYAGGDYTLVTGIGLNMSNAAPTTSLDALAAAARLPPFQLEKLLARILSCFEDIYNRFCRVGWDRDIEDLYYRHWLHNNQIVTLENEDGVRARIKGITRSWGLLLAEELGWEDRPTGKIWQLQSDSNSFDFFKGLIKRKL